MKLKTLYSRSVNGKTKIECLHEKGDFQYWLTQGIKYFKCKKCEVIYEELYWEELYFKSLNNK